MDEEVNAPIMSVWIPVYKGERYLRVAVVFLLSQTLRIWKLIICDIASTDGTEMICREYAARDS